MTSSSKFKNYKSGFSLLELLLYITLFSTVIMVISSFFVSMIGSKQKNQAISEVEQQGYFIMEKILTEVRNAEGIYTPALSDTTNRLSIDTVLVAVDPTEFSLIDEDIYIQRGVDSPVKLNSDLINISNLYFSNYARPSGAEVISVFFTLSRDNPDNRTDLRYDKDYFGTAAVKR